MERRSSFPGHRLHSMLVILPLGLLLTAFPVNLVYRSIDPCR